MKKLLFFLLFPVMLHAAGYSISGVSISGGVAAPAESNVIIAGNNTDYSGTGTYSSQSSGSNACYTGLGFNATTGTNTLRYGYFRTHTSTTASNVKMLVYVLSSGTTFNLLDTSNAVAFAEDTLMEFTFSGTNTITAGTGNVIIAIIADGYMEWSTGGSNWAQRQNSSGSYASPPSSVDTSTDTVTTGSNMEIYISNYEVH